MVQLFIIISIGAWHTPVFDTAATTVLVSPAVSSGGIINLQTETLRRLKPDSHYVTPRLSSR
jgi:hypothetical protein